MRSEHFGPREQDAYDTKDLKEETRSPKRERERKKWSANLKRERESVLAATTVASVAEADVALVG